MGEIPLYRHSPEESHMHGTLRGRLQGGLVFKAHRLFYHSTLGLRVIKKRKKKKKDRLQTRGGRASEGRATIRD